MLIEKIYKKIVDSSGVLQILEKSKVCMFFSLKGPNFNGNEFAKLAVQKGLHMLL